MDKILSYLIVLALGAFVIIGGNYFLTDDVGNFSMEKAKNLLPNIEVAIEDKKNEITGTRDINKDMTDEKAAERLSVEGAAEHQLVGPQVGRSVTEEYFIAMNTLDASNETKFHKQQQLKEIQDHYLSEMMNWTAIINDVTEYDEYIMMNLELEDNDYRWNTLFCAMHVNGFTRTSLRNIKKGDEVTVTGRYRRSDDDPWLMNCKIVN